MAFIRDDESHLGAVASRERDRMSRKRGKQMTGYGPLKLHVPEPAVRPGGTPDFSSVRIPRAGSVARPAVDADPEAIRDLAYSIIRVLNRDGEAVGPWAALLSDEALLVGLRDMMTLRAFDARMLMAQRQGKQSFYMQHMGEEAVSCAFQKALLPGDMNFPTYRQAELLIAAGHSLVDMMCQIYSNEQDPLKGRQLPVGVNKIMMRPVWDGAGFVPRKMMNLSSSFDHRVIDGWDAATFVQSIRTLLETPALIFVDD
jgi:hypothetical protein